MKKAIILILTIFSLSATATEEQALYNQEFLQKVAKLRDYALNQPLAYRLTESLTTEVGPRLGGSANDAKAVAWAKAKFEQLGFDRVTLEPVTFRRWIRGEETAEVIKPFAQPLTITALGRSNPTPAQGITGELVHFATLDALKQAPASEVKGKIVFISNRMERHKDGSGYGKAVVARSMASQVTAAKGGIGVIIRSIGTDNNRTPHTGVMRYDEKIPAVPAGAVSNPDADLLVNMLNRKQAVTIKYRLTSHWGEEYTSYNVIGDMLGSEHPEQMIVIGGHLDSWDLGTGAIDDASGCAITMATASLIKQQLGSLKRTVRVVLFANEEYGLSGAEAYQQKYQSQMQNHILAGESDFGAGTIYGFSTQVAEHAMPVVKQITQLLKPLGIEYKGNQGGYGPDLIPLRQQGGVAVFSLNQDGTQYFDYHHTANDTLDKIDPKQMAQNVAAWIVVVALAANSPQDFGFKLSSTKAKH